MEQLLNITLDDVEYSLSMKWNQDDTAQFFVSIDNELIELNTQMQKDRHDVKRYVTSKQIRATFAQEIKNILAARRLN